MQTSKVQKNRKSAGILRPRNIGGSGHDSGYISGGVFGKYWKEQQKSGG